MTNAEKRIMRNTTMTIEKLMEAIVSMADSAVNAYNGTPAGILYEKLYIKLRAVKGCAEFDVLHAAAHHDPAEPVTYIPRKD